MEGIQQQLELRPVSIDGRILCHCMRCGRDWLSTRKGEPMTCRFCKSAFWKTARKRRVRKAKSSNGPRPPVPYVPPALSLPKVSSILDQYRASMGLGEKGGGDAASGKKDPAHQGETQ